MYWPQNVFLKENNIHLNYFLLFNTGTFQTPGPGTYKPEMVPRMTEKRPPMYSMSYRYPPVKKFQTPGPDKYQVPSTLGPKVPDKIANAAYSMYV